MFAFLLLSLNILALKSFNNNISKIGILMNHRFKENEREIAILKDKIKKIEDKTSGVKTLIALTCIHEVSV